jgi:restriction system protein
VVCPYCKRLADQVSELDLWELCFEDFEKAHIIQSRRMKRVGLAPPSKHLRLNGHILAERRFLYICSLCGWWVAIDRAILPAVEWQYWDTMLVASSVLKELDLSDIGIPSHEVRQYLMRRYDARRSLHPKIFEETVASVFRDHGYTATVTAYSNDGGIDIILRGKDNEQVGVQVKRRARSIQVEQIRAFLGALILGGYTRGIFVSASKYQCGALEAARRSTRYVPIELIDAQRFLELLEIAQLKDTPDPSQCGLSRDHPPHFTLYSSYHLNML